MYKRVLSLKQAKGTFFLWGPRQSGKTSLLRQEFPKAHWLDLLLSDEFIRYSQKPSDLRHELLLMQKQGTLPEIIVIDEVQKCPMLLDEVHWLIENLHLKFALCGSSARKLKREHANLLGGRALKFALQGLSAIELGPNFDLVRMLNRGTLPAYYDAENARDRLRSYVSDYLKEEIAAEAVVRNLPAFSTFLHVAALCDSEQVEFASIARDVEVSPPTIREYFEILYDTYLGQFLAPFKGRGRLTRKIVSQPKFYFFDVGVVNFLAKRGDIQPGSELFGKAFENWVFHELTCYRNYFEPDLELHFWKTHSPAVEVDFILGDMEIAIEAKGTQKVTLDHLKGLRALKEQYPKVKRRIIVCLEARSRLTEDGIEVLSIEDFMLHSF